MQVSEFLLKETFKTVSGEQGVMCLNTDSQIHSEKFLLNWAKLALERFLTASDEQQSANQREKTSSTVWAKFTVVSM